MAVGVIGTQGKAVILSDVISNVQRIVIRASAGAAKVDRGVLRVQDGVAWIRAARQGVPGGTRNAAIVVSGAGEVHRADVVLIHADRGGIVELNMMRAEELV